MDELEISFGENQTEMQSLPSEQSSSVPVDRG